MFFRATIRRLFPVACAAVMLCASAVAHVPRASISRAPSVGGATDTRIGMTFGQGWTLELPEGVTVTRSFNDMDTAGASSLSVGGVTYTVSNVVHSFVHAQAGARSGGAPSSAWSYNAHNEPMKAEHGGGASGVELTRYADGPVSGRTDLQFGRTTAYTKNKVGWLEGETNPERTLEYALRQDGIRNSVTINGRKTEYDFTPAGRLVEARNLQLGPHLTAPYEGPILATVGPGGYTNIEAAVKAVFAERGPVPFDEPKIIAVIKTPYTNDVFIRDTGTFGDDFDDETGSSWTPGAQTSGGTVNLAQIAIRIGDSGYAPRFAAGDGQYAYLLHTLSPAPTNVMAESFWMHILSEDLSGTDKAVIFRSDDNCSNPLIEFALEYDIADGLVLRGYHQQVTGTTTNLAAAGTAALASGGWHKISFVHEADTDPTATGNGRFRWWLGTNEIASVDGINAAPNAPYVNLALGLYAVSGCSVDVVFDDLGVAGLSPAADAPLIIRSLRERQVSVTANNFFLSRQSHVRLQSLRFDNAATNALLRAEDAEGAALASCIVTCDVLFTNCPQSAVIGNTFDYLGRTNRLFFTDCSNAVVRNTIFLNNTLGQPPRAWTNTTIAISHNMYHPLGWIDGAETDVINANPMLHATEYCITDGASPAIASGAALARFGADLNGRRRHPTTPCRGAVEYHVERVGPGDVDAGGRILRRDVAGHVMEYDYTSTGALASFTDADDPANNATYTYDYMGRRIGMTVGSTAYRFVYLGDDVVAEYIDEGNNGTVDRTRVYWILPDIDKRIGFVDFDADGAARLYYYLVDHQQTVLQIVDSAGAVVNTYDYDAFGNVAWDSTNVATNVPNRYLFQGREWDEHAGHYYYRYRTYLPEHGVFTGPDMYLGRGITAYLDSLSSYLAMGGNPARYVDPLGLWWWDAGLIEYGAGGLLGFYGRENRKECWRGSGRLTAQSTAIFANEMTFGATDGIGWTRTQAYVGAEADAARAISRVARTVEIGLLTYGALGAVSTAVAAQGGSVALYGTAAIRAGVTTLAVNSAGQNAGSATEALMEGRTSDAIGYTALAATDAFFASKLMWTSRPLPAPSSTPRVGPTVENAKSLPTPTAGQKVYRVYGGDSAAGGASWSPVDPRKVSNFRDAAGLPSGGASGYNNTGRFVIEGSLTDPSKVVRTRLALSLDGNTGGLPEYIVPDWMNNGAIRIDRVSGVNLEF